MDEVKIEDFKIDIADTILPQLINNLIKDGIIQEDELDNKSLIYKKVQEFLDNTQYDFTHLNIDHRDAMLLIAKNNYDENYEVSLTMFATIIEHTLNSIIKIYCINKALDIKTHIEIIRNVNIRGKYTWLLSLMGFPTIKESYTKLIQQISDERNSYVHYKWKTVDFENDNPKIELVKLEKLINYIKQYETEILYNGNKNRIDKITTTSNNK